MKNIFIVKRRGLAFWLGIGLIIIMIILAGANTNNSDLETSIIEFNHINYVRQGEWLNFLIEHFCRNLGISFEFYHLFLYAVGYSLIFSTLFKYFGFRTYILLLYFIYPFTIDFIQTPNFCSMALFIFATRFLVDVEKNRNKILYIVFILLSAGMHSMAYVYLPILPVVIYSKKNNILHYGFIFGIVGITLGIFDRLSSFIPKLVTLVTDDSRIAIYFTGYTHLGFLLYWVTQILLMLTAAFMLKVIYSSVENEVLVSEECVNTESVRYAEIVFLITCYGLLLMPIVGYAGTVFRLVRNYFILVYAILGYGIKHIYDARERLLLYIITFLFPLFMFYLESDAVKASAFSLFSNNWFLP